MLLFDYLISVIPRLLSSSNSHYERLDLKRDASKKDIKSAYFTKAKQVY